MPKSKPPRKKRKPATAAGKGRRQTQPALPPMPDRRAMEGFMASLAGRQDGGALGAAQELMYDAWDAPTKRARVALARKALRLSPLCADAYVLLAEETARSVAETLDFYRQGVEAGEMALGKAGFKSYRGRFWGHLETRPYMRARCGLAQALWALDERDDAVAHYRDMLKLNPNDNQGIRYLLAACLVAMERDGELAALLKKYDDGTAAWAFTRALAAFRRNGDTETSRRLLANALASNRHVPSFLMGDRKLPRAAPQYIAIGGEDEAIAYAQDFGAGWSNTAGALVWLADIMVEAAVSERRRRR